MRTELWVTVATLLAAVAACASAIAAFQQERATFTSALYAKEVDAVGSYLSESWRLGNKMGDFVGVYRDYLDKSGDPALKSQMETLANEFSNEVSDFQTQSFTTGLVLPPNYQNTMNDMFVKVVLMGGYVSAILKNAQNASANRDDPNIKGADDARGDLDQIWLKFKTCATMSFRKGEFLKNDDVNKCPAGDPPPKSQ